MNHRDVGYSIDTNGFFADRKVRFYSLFLTDCALSVFFKQFLQLNFEILFAASLSLCPEKIPLDSREIDQFV
jgi:hypothetical protein